MNIYEMKKIHSAYVTENMYGWSCAVETDAGQFHIATDRPERAESLGALLMSFMTVPSKREVVVDGEISGERGWEAWVFDRTLCAMVTRELHRIMDEDKTREVGEMIPIPTAEEVEEIYRKYDIPKFKNDVKQVFMRCVEVGDDGRPITGVELPIEAFWSNGRFK